MKDFTPNEARFIRRSIKDALSALNEERNRVSGGGDMIALMAVEGRLAEAEQAWEKVKKGLL